MTRKKKIQRPLLNPVLHFLPEPRPFPPSTGGKSKKHIKADRLLIQRKKLTKNVMDIRKTHSVMDTHAGRLFLWAEMFDDSLSPSLTPDGIFDDRKSGSFLVSSLENGYLVECNFHRLDDLQRELSITGTVPQQVDVSRIKSIRKFETKESISDEALEETWRLAHEKIQGNQRKRSFSIWLLPYVSLEAKGSVKEAFITTLKHIQSWSIGSSPPEDVGIARNNQWFSSQHKKSSKHRLNEVLRDYMNGKNPRIPISLIEKSQLRSLVASGTVYRIDPVFAIATTAPGIGPEPGPPAPNVSNAPVVAVVDGGFSSHKYAEAEAWRPQRVFVPDYQADRKHGNQVVSLIVDAKGWNNRLVLPGYNCRFAPVQVVPKESESHNFDYDEQDLIDYLEQVIKDHRETPVWNFSFNQAVECQNDRISFLGHSISRLARKYGILPIISAGNKEPHESLRIAPPADCEAALIVAGRKHNEQGQVDSPCERSRCGLGPEGTLKPDVSWFSRVRVLGGKIAVGTSYATPLISRSAVHVWNNLRTPTPDLVRALLINRCDLAGYNSKLGWGSPVLDHEPWECPEGAVTLIWTSQLQAGYEYIWEDIYIPTTMMNGDKLSGEIRLVAILNPAVDDELIGNYFKSRLEIGLQYRKEDGETKNLLGSMPAGTSARWHPIRVHKKSFSATTIPQRKLRLRARIYLRERFKHDDRYGASMPENQGPFGVAFALTFMQKNSDPETYNSLVKIMGNKVRSAVVEQHVEI
jgi:hypothetical protein